MAPLEGLNTSYLKDQSLKKLLNLLEGVRGKKSLVLDRALSGSVGLIAKFSTLQDYGVDTIFWLQDGVIEHTKLQKNVVVLCNATSRNARLVAAQVQANSTIPGGEFEHSVFLVPRRTLVFEKILEEQGVLGDVTIGEYPLYFIPLEPDLLSLELESSFEELYLRKDYTSIFYSAKALMELQQKFGLFPRIIGKGDLAWKLAETLMRMRNEVVVDEGLGPLDLAPSSIIENIVIIERGVDPVTPLLTQLTYEGLIDETFGIKHSKVELDPTIIGAGPTPAPNAASSSSNTPITTTATKKRTVNLDSSDTLYEELRDTNFTVVGNILNKIALRLSADYEGRHQAKTVTEIRQFVSKLSGLQQEHASLKVHTGMAEEITKTTRSDFFNKCLEVQQNLAAGSDPSSQNGSISELMMRGTPVETVLRLLTLESVLCNGLRPKDLDNFKREVRHAYGHQHILTLDALEKMGLLLPKHPASLARTNYNTVRKNLNLIVDEVNEQDPDDIAYVYSGYAPLSIRLVQCVVQKDALGLAGSKGKGHVTGGSGWRGFEEAIRGVGGRTFDEIQSGEDKAVRARMILNGYNERKLTVVFFLGGCTFTEIAALRFLAKKDAGKREILICTTGIINGDKMMKAAIPNLKH
ncbi:Sec1-like protein [Ascobolus immersus RN42]|uniref:Sec1-like protein n=1 Tax=Ascobolus immersus RN42 TaxID=1160509 RepID=A0A3N4I7F4_ASCIM|nr:Sec1-like protein [Ascobolus immersus RN42]